MIFRFNTYFLSRYNDSGQPVCKVCNVAVKDEGFWMGHLASKGHKEVK